MAAIKTECTKLETEVSFVRRLAQGRIDILDAERDRRASGGSLEDLIGSLSKILAADGPRPPPPPAPLPPPPDAALPRQRVARGPRAPGRRLPPRPVARSERRRAGRCPRAARRPRTRGFGQAAG